MVVTGVKFPMKILLFKYFANRLAYLSILDNCRVDLVDVLLGKLSRFLMMIRLLFFMDAVELEVSDRVGESAEFFVIQV